MTSSTSAAAESHKKLRAFFRDFERWRDNEITDETLASLYTIYIEPLKADLIEPQAQQTDDTRVAATVATLSGLRTVTMANQYKGKELWEVQIGGETAYYVGTLEEVIEKAKTHENYLHDEPLRGKPKPDQWNAGYPIGKIEKVGTLAG